MTTREALELIVANDADPDLNYAINYAEYALSLLEDTEELRVQCLYVANNLATWRHPQAKEARAAIKAATISPPKPKRFRLRLGA